MEYRKYTKEELEIIKKALGLLIEGKMVVVDPADLPGDIIYVDDIIDLIEMGEGC